MSGIGPALTVDRKSNANEANKVGVKFFMLTVRVVFGCSVQRLEVGALASRVVRNLELAVLL